MNAKIMLGETQFQLKGKPEPLLRGIGGTSEGIHASSLRLGVVGSGPWMGIRILHGGL